MSSALRAQPLRPSLEEAFRRLFDQEFSYVCRSLRRLGVHPGDLEDQAQEVFLRVARRFEEYDPERPIRPWLFAFAHRAAANYRRLARHLHEAPGESYPELPSDATPEHALLDAEKRARLLAALQRVPLSRRSALILHDIDGFRAPEIAEALGIPVNTVYSRARVGRAELKKALGRAERAEKGRRR